MLRPLHVRPDDLQHFVDDLPDGFSCRIDPHRILGNLERRHLASAVDLVPRGECRADIGDRRRSARMRRVGGAPSRALFWCRVEINFHISVRKYDSADVASFHHDAARGAEAALAFDEYGTNLRHPRDGRRGAIDLWCPNRS